MTQHDGSRGTPDRAQPGRPVVRRRSAFTSTPDLPAVTNIAASHTPDVPDKLYFRIGEVARLCAVQTYVLRFWETEFPQLRPNKGGTGQRLFRRRDVEMALRIRHLLYNEGYTIPGARQLLKAELRPRETQLALTEDAATRDLRADRLRTLYRSLCDLYGQLSATPGTLKPKPPPTLPELLAQHAANPAPPRRAPARQNQTLPQSLPQTLFDALDPPPPLHPTRP